MKLGCAAGTSVVVEIPHWESGLDTFQSIAVSLFVLRLLVPLRQTESQLVEFGLTQSLLTRGRAGKENKGSQAEVVRETSG